MRVFDVRPDLGTISLQRYGFTLAFGDCAMKKLLLILALTAVPAVAKEVLPFIDNDYTKALAEAKRKNVPLFVDAWAPW